MAKGVKGVPPDIPRVRKPLQGKSLGIYLIISMYRRASGVYDLWAAHVGVRERPVINY